MTKIKIQSKSNRLSNEYCKIVPFNNFYELRLEIADSVFRIFGQYSKHQAVIAARYVGRALNKFLKKETEALQTELTVLHERVAVLEKHIIAVHEAVRDGTLTDCDDIVAVFNTPEVAQ
jgi:predicted transcriptional regulator